MSFVSSSYDDNDENDLNRNINKIINSEKLLIYKHQLFPLLTYLLEQCERATVSPSFSTGRTHGQTSFEYNFKKFLTKHNDLLTISHNPNDLSSIIDEFYIDAMQVLRIHLLELEKLDDLCKDFCQRYITCLKVKLNPNNIFIDDESDDDDDDDDDFELDIDEDLEFIEESNQRFLLNQEQYNMQNNFKILNQNRSIEPINTSNLMHPKSLNGPTLFPQMLSNSSSSILFNTMSTKQQKCPTMISLSKRNVLPKSATAIMRSWLFQHITHPYPSEDEKRSISNRTNLSLLQVNNWFINARRRILQPMFETSNPDLLITKKKKQYDQIFEESQQNKSSHRISSANRYWSLN